MGKEEGWDSLFGETKFPREWKTDSYSQKRAGEISIAIGIMVVQCQAFLVHSESMVHPNPYSPVTLS